MDEKLHPIRTICEQTGINPVTLRAWERRYGLFVPHRTPKGHRLYTQADIERVKHIQFLLSQGHPIRAVKGLLGAESHAAADDMHAPVVDFTRLAQALRQLNTVMIYQEIGHLVAEYGPELFAMKVYPQMHQYLEQQVWPDCAVAEIAHQLLLDTVIERLRQFLRQAKSNRQLSPVFVAGYRSGMISARLIQGLLLANILRAHGHAVTFVSNITGPEHALNIAQQHEDAQVVVSTNVANFYQSLLLNAVDSAHQARVWLYAPNWSHRLPCCLPDNLSEVYAYVQSNWRKL